MRKLGAENRVHSDMCRSILAVKLLHRYWGRKAGGIIQAKGAVASSARAMVYICT